MLPHLAENLTYELCQTFLADKPGWVAVYRLFIDESGTDDGAPVVVVAGYLALPTRWRKFESEWLPIIRQARPRISAWHAADAQNLVGEFKEWTSEGVAATASKLLPIIPKYCHGAAIAIDQRDVENELEKRPDLRRYFTDTYGMCLQWLVMCFLDRMHRFNEVKPIALVHERNQFQGRAMAVFDHLKENADPSGVLRSLSFGDKVTFPPLQAADVLAYEAFRRLKNPHGPERRALTAIAPQGKAPRLLTFSNVQKNIHLFIEMLNALKEAHEAGLLADGARFRE